MNIWKKIEEKTVEGGIFFLSLILIWFLVTILITSFENSRSYFGIREVLISKCWLAAIVYLVKYLLFPQTQLGRKRVTQIIFWVLLVINLTFEHRSLWQGFKNGLYLVALLFDAVFWSMFITYLIEKTIGVFKSWIDLARIDLSLVMIYWQKVWQDILRIGVLMTFSMSLAYYSLVTFYLVDTILYSYLLGAPIVISGMSLFIIFKHKINSWVNAELLQVDKALGGYIDQVKFFGKTIFDSMVRDSLPGYQYLILSKNYLNGIKKPLFSFWVIICFLIFTVWMLFQPHIYGVVIEVGSFN